MVYEEILMQDTHRQENTRQTRIIPCVGIVCFRGEDVLLIQRGRPPRQGQWSIPGGKTEFGERAEDAALRELMEETSVQADLVGVVDVIDGFFESDENTEPKRHYLLCDYAARWVSGEPVAGDDAADAKFVCPDTLADIPMWNETRRIIEAARTFISSK